MPTVHDLVISQGPKWAFINFRNKGDATATSAGGSWKKSTDKTTDDSTIEFTSSHPDYVKWTWTSTAPGLLLFGVESDQGSSSHKTGDGKWLQVLIRLEGAKRDASGKFSVAGGDTGKGKLTYRVGDFFTAGDITWEMSRYQ